MISAMINTHGGLSHLTLAERDIPAARPGEAIIRIHFSALNHLDLFVLEGMPGMKLPLPLVPGSDFSGTIENICDPDGRRVSTVVHDDNSYNTGDAVAVYPVTSCGECPSCRSGREHDCRHFGIYGETRDGGHCQYINVPLRNLYKLPSEDNLKAAAAGGLTYLTVHEMLINKAAAVDGETVLVLAANSGIGSAAIQMAKYLGCEVIATAGNEEKAAFARKLGADHVIDHYADTDWYKQARQITMGRGADIVIEHPGQATFSNSLRSLANGGRLVTCGAGSGPLVSFDLRHLFIKQQQIIGSTMGPKNSFFEVQRLIADKKLRPMISQEYKLSDIKTAYNDLIRGKQLGKMAIYNSL